MSFWYVFLIWMVAGFIAGFMPARYLPKKFAWRLAVDAGIILLVASVLDEVARILR